jgi:ribosomal protein S18 acetylase RimI-like enzyme
MNLEYRTGSGGLTPEQLASGFWVGWPVPPTLEQHLAMLQGAEVAVVAIDPSTDSVVGYVTVIGDGVLTGSIPLLEVLPGWQGRGIGSELVRRALEALGPRYMVDLVCDDDLVPFYERLGFRRHGAMIRRDRSVLGRGS